LYKTRIIDIFGTDVSVASTHGGIFYQQSVVKSCFGGAITNDMIHEIDSSIAKVPPGPLSYLRYRSLGIFDVKGGNPELPRSQYPQIIASFPQDPAVTGFNSVPLWQVAPAKYQAALQAAIAQYTNANQASVTALIGQISAQNIQSYKNPQNIFVYATQTEQLGNIIYWKNCPFVKEGGNYYTPRCTYSMATDTLNSGQVANIINYNYYNLATLLYQAQRDAGSGTARIYYDMHKLLPGAVNATDPMPYNVQLASGPVSPSQLQNSTGSASDTTMSTPWQHTGCVSMDFLHLNTCPGCKLSFTVYIDCLPVVVASPARYGLKDTDLQCVCPSF